MKLNDNEKVITKSGMVYLAEQTLTDRSKVYAILIDRVRIDCVGYDQACNMMAELTQTGEYMVSVQD